MTGSVKLGSLRGNREAFMLEMDEVSRKQVEQLSKFGVYHIKLWNPYREHSIVIEEYKLLDKMHEVLPDNTPRPIWPIRNGHGYPVAFFMRRIDGEALGSLIAKDAVPEGTLEKLGGIIATLHAHELAHGDLHSDNVIIESKTNRIFLVDPQPWSFEVGRKRDLEGLKDIAQEAQKLKAESKIVVRA